MLAIYQDSCGAASLVPCGQIFVESNLVTGRTSPYTLEAARREGGCVTLGFAHMEADMWFQVKMFSGQELFLSIDISRHCGTTSVTVSHLDQP